MLEVFGMSRQEDIDGAWELSDREALAIRFDHLSKFLPADFDTVLDVAGGSGALHDSLSGWKKHRYTLVDISSEAVTQARARGIDATQWDVDSGPLPFPDNSFDIVFATHILEHVRNPWALLYEMARVSKRYVFIYSPNFAWWKCRMDLLRGRPIRHMVMDKYGSVFDARGRHTDHIYFLTYANVSYRGQQLGLVVRAARAFWYRRYAPFRWFLEPLFKNWGQGFEMILEKKDKQFRRPEDRNFRF
jgi:methionine biosynthesis protein MetW